MLLWPSFHDQCRDLFTGIVELIRTLIEITDLSNDYLTQVLLYGHQDLSNGLNRKILEMTLRFISETSGLIKIFVTSLTSNHKIT